jgi:hypothetical protein
MAIALSALSLGDEWYSEPPGLINRVVGGQPAVTYLALIN